MSCWYKKSNSSNGIIISSRVRLARNISDLPFPRRMSESAFSDLKSRVKSAVEDMSANDGIKLKYIEMDDIPENEINAMVERHVISPGFAKNFEHRAIAISADESVSVMIGEEDHIRIQVLLPGEALDEAYKLADTIDDALNSRLGFAFDSELGFLTECPTNIGTGLRASVMIHLPVCEAKGEMATITDTAGKIGFTVRGMYGEGSKAAASLYQISNQITLGISEKTAVDNLKVIAQQIVEREKLRRAEYDRLDLEDKVFRALGTLKFARILSSDEFMKLISLIKLGVDEGIIQSENIDPVDMLIEAQPYMLMKKYSVMGPAERDEARAKMMRMLLETIEGD